MIHYIIGNSDGLPINALGVYLPGRLRADNLLTCLSTTDGLKSSRIGI